VDLRFDPCFDDAKLSRVEPYLPRTYAVLNAMAPWRRGRWPTRVKCMSDRRIAEGRRRGAGHGLTYVCSGGHCRDVWINPYMTWQGHWLVLVHESLHHAFPDATEAEINCVLVPNVFQRVFGRRMSHAWGRQHGLGSPVPGVGDRSYCR
jgi:hypothetical protein